MRGVCGLRIAVRRPTYAPTKIYAKVTSAESKPQLQQFAQAYTGAGEVLGYVVRTSIYWRWCGTSEVLVRYWDT